MTYEPSGKEQLLKRIESMERRFDKAVKLNGALILTVGALMLMAQTRNEIKYEKFGDIDAHRLRAGLVDADQVYAKFNVDVRNPSINGFASMGRNRISLGSDSDKAPHIVLFERDGQLIINYAGAEIYRLPPKATENTGQEPQFVPY